MILTDREIEIALESNSISIIPAPSKDCYSSTSLDLTLDPTIYEFKDGTSGVKVVLDPSEVGYNHSDVIKAITERRIIDSTLGYDFEPGKLILAWTIESVELKPYSRLAARVEGKSSLARLGIGVHITAPTIHSGFTGQIQLEMINHGRNPIKLKPSMKICQIIFEQTIGTPVKGYLGRFSGQRSNS